MRTVVNVLAWAVPGFLIAFAVASLPSIGLLVLPVAIIALALSVLVTKGRGAAGVLVGAGMVGLLLAYLHRQGPGEACRANPALGCGTYLDPVPFLVAGIAAVLLGVGIELLARRARARRKPQATLEGPAPAG